MIAFVALRGLVGLHLSDLRRNAPLCFQRVKGVLKPQEITFRQTKELAQAQVGITSNVTGSIDHRMDAIASRRKPRGARAAAAEGPHIRADARTPVSQLTYFSISIDSTCLSARANVSAVSSSNGFAALHYQ